MYPDQVACEEEMKREFAIFSEPNIADPAWLVPLAELKDGNWVRYSTADELAQAAWKLQYDLGYNSGRNSENVRAHKFLEHIKCSPEQIREFMSFRG